MRKSILFLLLLISLLFAACSNTNLETAVVTDAIQATSSPDPENPKPSLSSKNQGQEGANDTSGDQSETGLVSECTLISSSKDQDSDQADFFTVTEDDWTFGPEDAAVTLIEYGDFQ